MRRVNRWTPEMVDDLKEWLGTFRAETIAKKLNRRYGTNFNKDSISVQTRKLGLVPQRNTGLYSLSMAAAELGCDVGNLARWCRSLGIKTLKPAGGYYRFIPDEGMARLREVLAPPPEPCTHVKAVARELGVARQTVDMWVHLGKLRVHRQGRTVHVPLAEIERIRQERRTG